MLSFTDVYTYDRRDRLTKQTRQIGTGSIETIAANTYDPLGDLITKNVGGTTGNLQKVDYKYNIRGWLAEINNASMDYVDGENDLFQFAINYNQSAIQNKNLFNGNISSVWVRTKVDNSFKGYVYWYDHLNRLTQAKNMYYHRPGGWLMGQYMDDSYGEAVSYDKNGNILTLDRTGELLDAQQALTIDNLTYAYNGNQLLSVTDNSSPTVNDGFKDGNKMGDDYAYDTFGNITQDKNKSIAAISYNHLNLPYQVTFGNGSNIKYTYDAAGTRLKKQVQPNGGALVTTDYVNGFQYTDNVLKFFPHPEGYVEFKNNQYLYTYQYKDHLGNIRLTYRDGYRNHPTLEYAKDGVIQVTEIIEENNYYPFGLKHKGYNDLADYSATNKYKYAYGGKELNDELGLDLYDFGARNYDAAIGRWLNVDPLAENSRRWTPYNYAYNNPIVFVDPDGMQSESIIIKGAKENYTYNEETKYTGNDKFIKAALQAIKTLQSSQTGSAMIEELDHSNNDFNIESGTKDGFKPKSAMMSDPSISNTIKDSEIAKGEIGSGGTITWTEDEMRMPTTTSENTSSTIILGHEMGHALDSNRGKLDSRINETSKKEGENFSRSEWQAVYRENLIRSELLLPLRTHYGRSLEAGTGKYLGPLGTGMLGPNNEIIKPVWYD